jgi:hypothetical protein
MIQRLPAKSLYRLVNRAQLDVVDRLEAQFPAVPWNVIYEMVSHSRVVAAKQLPDIAAYADTLERQASQLILASRRTAIVQPPSGDS